jgi:hypothetical protein
LVGGGVRAAAAAPLLLPHRCCCQLPAAALCDGRPSLHGAASALPRSITQAIACRRRSLPAAAVFGAIDALLQLTMRPLARRFLSPKSGGKAPSDADVTKALVILVSFLHLAIQVGSTLCGAAACAGRPRQARRAAAACSSR